MGKYTIYGENVDNYLQKNYMEKIITSFKRDVRERLIAIILFGGFAKGEGSIQIINNKAIPFNDFDFYVITKEKLSDETLDSISHNASKEIGMGGMEIAYFPGERYDVKKFFHVDVRCIPYDLLPKLMKTQRYYELKYKSQVIYGDPQILGLIPEIKPEDIPFSEGLRNLFNKLHTMLLGLREDYTEDQKKISIFWSYKSYISCCESLLILAKVFAPSSLERSKLFSKIYKEKFPDLYEKIPNLAQKVQIATNFKVRLDFSVDHDKLWRTALKDLLTVFEYFLNKITGHEVETALINDLPYNYFEPHMKEKIGFNFYPAQYLLNWGYYKVLREKNESYMRPLFHWKDVGIRMIVPMYYLLKFRLENKMEYLDKAHQHLQKFIRVEKKEFWHLRERSLKAFGLYYQQRLL